MTDNFQKKLKKLFKKNYDSISEKLLRQVYPSLKLNPQYWPQIKKLKNYKPETWRYRIADYRLFYEIDENEKIVFMITVDHRKDCY